MIDIYCNVWGFLYSFFVLVFEFLLLDFGINCLIFFVVVRRIFVIDLCSVVFFNIVGYL